MHIVNTRDPMDPFIHPTLIPVEDNDNKPMANISTLISNGSQPLTTYMGASEAVIASLLWSLIILTAIIGNVMVIVAIFKSPALYIVQNFLLVSLAVADILVAVLVMPFSLTSTLLGQWIFGRGFCLFHVTCDVLLCTASILHLVAIALDRLIAVTFPLRSAATRNVTFVLLMILACWVVSGLISIPPLIGWNDMSDDPNQCGYVSEKGYIIYSSLGSFYIPLCILVSVYLTIFISARRRLRRRAMANNPYAATSTIVLPTVEMASMDSPDKISDTAHSTNTTYTATSPGQSSLRSTHLIPDDATSNSLNRCQCRTVWRPPKFLHKESSNNSISRPSLLRGWSWPWFPRQRRCSLCQGIKNVNTATASVVSSFHVVHEDDLSNACSPIVDLTSSSRSLQLNPPTSVLPHHLCSYPDPDGTVPLLDIRVTSSSNSLEQCETSMNSQMTTHETTSESKTVKKYLFVPKTSRSTSSSRRQLDDCRKTRSAANSSKTAALFYRCCSWWPAHGYSLGQPSRSTKKATSGLVASTSNGSHLSEGSAALKLSQSQSSFDVKQSLAKRQKISLTKERRAARTLLIVVLVFVICWLPFFVWYVVKPFCPNCPMDERSYNFILWLGFLNSSLNPVIYTIFNLDFRKAFKKMLSGKRRAR